MPSVPESYQQIRGENSSYRAGLILGLTMAEIMLLLLFALMLIIGASWAVQKKEIAERDRRIGDMTARLAAVGRLTGPDGKLLPIDKILDDNARMMSELETYEDSFRDMRRGLPKATPKEILERVRKLVEADAKMGHPPPEDLPKKFEEAKMLEAALPGKTPEQIAKTLDAAKALDGRSPEETAEALKAVDALKKEMPGQTPKQIAEAAAAGKALKDLPMKPGETPAEALRSLIAANNNLVGQNKILIEKNKLLSGGKGNQFPSCWATPEGKEEAIFMVTFNEFGIETEERDLPNRVDDRLTLAAQLSNVRYNTTVDRAEFARMMRPIYQWSVEHDCRFHVVLRSRTDSTSNASINVVNSMFYPASRIIRVQ